jgi:hypothetical protein
MKQLHLSPLSIRIKVFSNLDSNSPMHSTISLFLCGQRCQ